MYLASDAVPIPIQYLMVSDWAFRRVKFTSTNPRSERLTWNRLRLLCFRSIHLSKTSRLASFFSSMCHLFTMDVIFSFKWFFAGWYVIPLYRCVGVSISYVLLFVFKTSLPVCVDITIVTAVCCCLFADILFQSFLHYVCTYRTFVCLNASCCQAFTTRRTQWSRVHWLEERHPSRTWSSHTDEVFGF